MHDTKQYNIYFHITMLSINKCILLNLVKNVNTNCLLSLNAFSDNTTNTTYI